MRRTYDCVGPIDMWSPSEARNSSQQEPRVSRGCVRSGGRQPVERRGLASARTGPDHPTVAEGLIRTAGCHPATADCADLALR
jgi:hypothetical protein